MVYSGKRKVTPVTARWQAARVGVQRQRRTTATMTSGIGSEVRKIVVPKRHEDLYVRFLKLDAFLISASKAP